MPRSLPRSRRGVVVAVLVALALPASAQARADEQSSRVVLDRIAAVVNDSVVLYSDVMMRATPMLADLRGISDPAERARRQRQLESKVLDELIAEELVIQAGKEAGVEVSGEEIDAALEEIQKNNNLSEDDFEQALSTQGYTMSGYRNDLERQMLRMRAANMLVRPRIKINEEMVKARYEEMKRESAGVSRVKLRHILIEVPGDGGEDARGAARDRAGELAQQARAGADFAELAREHSEDAATKADGGDLGWIDRGSLATEWEDLVFTMEAGEVRGPVTGPRGFHIFRVDDREREEVPPFEEAKEKLRQELFQEEMERETETWLEELRKDAHVEIKIEPGA